MNEKSLSIVIPAYNEERRIGKTLQEYGSFFEEKRKMKEVGIFEIVVVINNTRDNTEKIVRQFQRKYKEIRFLNFKQGGKGFAIIEGFKDAIKRNNNFIGFVDADMATSPHSFFELFKKIGNYDGILASRWMEKSVIKTPQTGLRIITSRGFNFLVRSLLFLPYTDTQCGAKLFKKEAIEKIIHYLEKGTAEWAFDVDLIFRMKKSGFRITEIPTVWEDKRGSKLSLIKVPFQMFSSILRIRLINSPFKFVVKMYDLMPEKIKIHSW